MSVKVIAHCCCGCNATKVCAYYFNCNGVWPIAGAVVQAGSCGSCTAGANGCCSFPSNSGCVNTMTVTFNGNTLCNYNSMSFPHCPSLSCAAQTIPPGYVCCDNGCLLPPTLVVTDANGTWNASVNGNGAGWSVSYTLSKTNVFIQSNSCIPGGGGGAECGVLGSDTIAVGYSINCAHNGALQVSGGFTGFAVLSPSFNGTPPLNQCPLGCDMDCDSSTVGNYNACVTANGAYCGYYNSSHLPTIASTTNAYTCASGGSMSWSGTLSVSAPSVCSGLWPASGWSVSVSS